MTSYALTAEETGPTSITRYLRWTGTVILLLGMSDFMIQGFDQLGLAYRYWVVAGFGTLFAACGLVCAYRWRETIGARLFFALGTACLPIQASQSAALLLHFFMSGTLQGYRGWWNYELLPANLIALNVLACGTLLSVIAHFGFSILARQHARRLSLALILGCLLILIPFRGTPWVPLFLIAQYVFLTRLDSKHFRHDAAMNLAEGWGARLLVWTPFAIMLMRSFFYPWSFIEGSVILALMGAALLRDVPTLLTRKTWQDVSRTLGTAFSLGAWWNFSTGLLALTDFHSDTVRSLVFLPMAGLLFVLPELIKGIEGRTYRLLGALIAAGTGTFELLGNFSYVDGVVSVAVGLGLLLGGVKHKERWIVGLGVLSLMVGLARYLGILIDVYHESPWLAMTGIGVATLLLTSYLEAQAKRLWATGQTYWTEIRSW
jgi:hypothetical protein